MLIRKAKKYRLKVRDKRLEAFCKVAGCQRFVWNKFLNLQKERLDTKERCLSYPEMSKIVTEWKKLPETSFLNEVPSQTLQQTLKDLDRALKDAFTRKKGFPKHKKRGVGDSFRYPQGIKFTDSRIYLPKIGWFCFYSSARIEGKICNVTVSRRGKHWYISVQTEEEVPEPAHPSSSRVGIDMGIKRFATLSTEEFFEPLNSFVRLEKSLTREQRKLSRKEKFSNNWKKQKRRVQNVHIKIANARQDYLHKISTQVSNNHATIAMEDLSIARMSSSKTEGNRSQKRKLNKRILDQGWYEFRRQIEYKQLWRGGKLVLVDPKNTSRTCPGCQHVSEKNRPSQSRFQCEQCSFTGHADWVGAINVLMAVGHTVPAYGDTRPVTVVAQESLFL